MDALSEQDRRHLAETQERIDASLHRLRTVEPYLLDLSIREPATGSPLGHTLEDKRTLFQLTGRLGFKARVVGTLTGMETVDDLFLKELRQAGHDTAGCFTFISPGSVGDGGFRPDASMLKLADYGTENVVFHVDISPPRRVDPPRTQDQVIAGLQASVSWVRQVLPEPTDTHGQVFVNLSDFLDCFRQEPEFACRVVKTIAALNPAGLMFEDPRGTFFPFQHAALVRWLRAYLPPPVRILVHPHAGNGLEHASVIDAVLAGADGAWLGFTTHAATMGHASGLAYLSNLMRAGNAEVAERFPVKEFVPSAETMAHIHSGQGPATSEPVAGSAAYRDVLANFAQTGAGFGDIPADRVGAQPGWRIVPALANPQAIAARLRETGLLPGADENAPVVTEMAARIRQSLIDGHKVRFDDEDQLAGLFCAIMGSRDG